MSTPQPDEDTDHTAMSKSKLHQSRSFTDTTTEQISPSSEKPSNDRPKLRTFSYSFWSPEIAGLRRAYLKIVVPVVVMIVVLMWITLPIYWGSLASSAKHTHNLEAWIVDRDGGQLGQAITQTFLSTSGPLSLGWRSISPAEAGTDADVAITIAEEKAWIAVVVEPNVSARLTLARQTGDKTYNPASAINVYYAQARNEIAANNFLVPIATQLLTGVTQRFAASSFASFLQSEGLVGNATALGLFVQAPATVVPGVSWTMNNLRPYTAPVAQAVTLVGQIYICIFAFITTMVHSAARPILEPYLTLRSYIRLRALVPLILYIPLSLFYSMVSLPFHLPFGTKFGTGGFFIFWAYIYLGMLALGLALESMITLLTARFVPFFLVLWIIANISSAVIPAELQPAIYKYGLGFPVWNMEQAIRCIIFNTANHLGRNAGILIGWIAISFISLIFFCWFARKSGHHDVSSAPRGGHGPPPPPPPPTEGGMDADSLHDGGNEKHRLGKGDEP
ncbi:hypothetical protein BD410DRAFT_768789 [Rickenella mellea]|uniref:DUF3533 domain-containing protein n=1 Tax=Rickenella mellea TaxID=50990 RepID=A0A4Y7Q782_9AGAM|nr:hypothetical protein BD410DRAFT_768789 [Rickenella mellea]